MPNLEELIEMRTESIKTQEEALKMIENAIKENSVVYYNKLNKILEKNANQSPLSNPTVIFGSYVTISSYPSVEYNQFVSWCKEVTNNSILKKTINKYISIQYENNPIIREKQVELEEDNETTQQNEAEEVTYIYPLYIKELAEKDNLTFEIQEPNEESGIFCTTYMITANIPKLEIEKSRTRSEELDQIREDANQIYLEQLELERNIIEKQLLENSIDYYTRVLYSNLKSNVENDSNLKVGSHTVKESGILINHDDDITESTFEALAKDFKILKADDIMRYISIDSNPTIYCQREDDSWIVRLNYLKELAEKDGLSFSVDSIYDGQINYSLTKQNLKKIEIPKHKVLTLED